MPSFADNRAIGIFDSGLGGLTAAAALMRLLPQESICYLGDTARTPYGGRSSDTIATYAKQDITFLLRQDIKAIIVACGTVSAVAPEQIRADFPVPIYGVLEPTVQAAIQATKTGRIGIIGTSATIASGAYERLLRKTQAELAITSVACPLFVPLVECGRTEIGDVVIETIAAEYLAPLKIAGIDTLILGCTHYPLLESVIAKYMGAAVTLVSSGAATADFVARQLRKSGQLAKRDTPPPHQYFVTDSTDSFAESASKFLQQDVGAAVQQICLD